MSSHLYPTRGYSLFKKEIIKRNRRDILSLTCGKKKEDTLHFEKDVTGKSKDDISYEVDDFIENFNEIYMDRLEKMKSNIKEGCKNPNCKYCINNKIQKKSEIENKLLYTGTIDKNENVETFKNNDIADIIDVMKREIFTEIHKIKRDIKNKKDDDKILSELKKVFDDIYEIDVNTSYIIKIIEKMKTKEYGEDLYYLLTIYRFYEDEKNIYFEMINSLFNDDDYKFYYLIGSLCYDNKKYKMSFKYLKMRVEKRENDIDKINSLMMLINLFLLINEGVDIERTPTIAFNKLMEILEGNDLPENLLNNKIMINIFKGRANYMYSNFFKKENEEEKRLKYLNDGAVCENIACIKELCNIFFEKKFDVSEKLFSSLLQKGNFDLKNKFIEKYKSEKKYSNVKAIYKSGLNFYEIDSVMFYVKKYMKNKLYNKAINLLKMILCQKFEKSRINYALGRCYEFKSNSEFDPIKKKYYKEITKKYYNKSIYYGSKKGIERLVYLMFEDNELEGCEDIINLGLNTTEQYYPCYLLMGILKLMQKKDIDAINILNCGILKDYLPCACLLGYYYENKKDEDNMIHYYNMSANKCVFSCIKMYEYVKNKKKKNDNNNKYFKILEKNYDSIIKKKEWNELMNKGIFNLLNTIYESKEKKINLC